MECREPRVIRDDGEHRQTPETIEPRLLTHPGQRTRRCRHRSAPDRGAVTRRLHSPTCLLKLGPDGVRALPAVEIVPESGMYDYHARYTAGTTEFFCPARLSDEIAATVSEVGLTVHSVLGLSDLSRSDVLVDDDGVVWFLEVNVAPGMTETSLMPQAISVAGLSVGDVLAGIIESD
ncbi:MAG: hypothetical protein EBZ17_10875 [Actinobacteria bacterium]|nr:hypothetical protein [Actinomycetota bacterium]